MDDEKPSLEGKIVVVTGGTGGIGYDLVTQSSNSGAKVIFTYNKGKERADRLVEKTEAKSLQLILGDIISTRSFLDTLKEEHYGIDYFIANAGQELSGDLNKHTWGNIQEVINVNLIGNLYLLQGLILGGLMKNGGKISVIGSIAASGNHDQFAYSAAKAGLRGAVESLSRYDSYVKSQKLGILLIEPAFVKTPMTERILKILERRIIFSKGGNDLVNEFKQKGYVMDASYVAKEILKLTIDPGITGIQSIPKNTNIHEIRERYF